MTKQLFTYSKNNVKGNKDESVIKALEKKKKQVAEELRQAQKHSRILIYWPTTYNSNTQKSNL